jgi:hypothetical protein
MPNSFRTTAKFERVALDFNARWTAGVDEASKMVTSSFTNFENGTSILHNTLRQLLTYYETYFSLLGSRFGKGSLPFREQPIGIDNVIVKIRKFRGGFQ